MKRSNSGEEKKESKKHRPVYIDSGTYKGQFEELFETENHASFFLHHFFCTTRLFHAPFPCITFSVPPAFFMHHFSTPLFLCHLPFSCIIFLHHFFCAIRLFHVSVPCIIFSVSPAFFMHRFFYTTFSVPPAFFMQHFHASPFPDPGITMNNNHEKVY